MTSRAHHTHTYHASVLALLLLVCSWSLIAQEIDDSDDGGNFTVLLAETDFKNDFYHLDAIFDLQLSHDLEEALHNGVTLSLVINTEVLETRDYLWDRVISSASQRYEFSYNPLTESYLLHNLNSGMRYQMPTLTILISHMSNLVDFPLIEAAQLRDEAEYYGQVQARVDVESLPVPLRLMAYISDGLDLSSAWQSWPLRKEVIGPLSEQAEAEAHAP